MVLFSAASEADQVLAKQKFLLVRRDKTEQFINHLLNKNKAYKDVTLNIDSLHKLIGDSIDEELVVDEGPGGDLITAAHADEDRVNNGIIGSSTTSLSSSGLFHFSKHNPKEPTCVEEICSNTNNHLRYLRVVNSNNYLNESDQLFYGSAFPHLFPYGIGTPNCERPVRVSVEDGLKHLLSLSDRKFGQDDVFVLSSFDRVARSKAVLNMYIKLRSDLSCASRAVEVSRDEMVALVQHNKDVKKAIRSGRQVPHVPVELQNASRVLRSVESVASSTYGTVDERKKMKTIVRGYTQVIFVCIECVVYITY